RCISVGGEEDIRIVHAIAPCCIEVRRDSSEFRETLISRHYTSPGRRDCQPVAFSKTRAARRRVSSAKAGARSWRPIGRPDLVRPQGMLTPGMPARLAVIV